jgi:arsenate reductase-like glutaredoxin family protein
MKIYFYKKNKKCLNIKEYYNKKKNEHVEIGKQSPLKKEWKIFLACSSHAVRTRVSKTV